MFEAASWSSICTDGIFENVFACEFTEICTDGIFSYDGEPPQPGGVGSLRSAIANGTGSGTGI